MKSVLFLSIFLYAITLPALGALSPEDLDKIRLIVKEEVEPIKTEVASDKTGHRIAEWTRGWSQ